jgi:hypothetical protein
MGGGNSQPLTITRKATRPRPTDNTHHGIRVADTEGCAECKLLIDKGVTSASAKITINPEPKADPEDPENVTIPDPTDSTGENMVNPNIYIPSNSITITPSAPFTGSFNTTQKNPYGIGQIQWDQMDLFWGAPIRVENSTGAGAQADACLIVRSSTSYLILMIPIQKTSDATKKGCKFFTKLTPPLVSLSGMAPAAPGGYDPNDDAHISDAWKKLGQGDAEAVKNKTAINNYIKYASEGHYDPDAKREKPPPYANTTIDTGSDWSLSSLVQGNEAYFTWIATVYGREDDNTVTEDKGGFRFVTQFKKWAPLEGASNADVGKLSPRIVYFQEPVYMLETDFAVLRGTVKAREPNEVVQEIITEKPPKWDAEKNGPKPWWWDVYGPKPNPRRVFYHPACCGAAGAQDTPGTKSSVAQTFAKVQSQQALDLWNQPWFQWMISAFILILMFVFLAWLLTYIHEVPDNIFATVGHLLVPPRPPVQNGLTRV